MLGLVADKPLDLTPGSTFSYSNTNYLLLGMLIEHLSGIGYAAFLTTRIFEPLGMTQTSVNDPAAVVMDRAHGYTRVPGQTINANCFSPLNALGAGNLLSSVDPEDFSDKLNRELGPLVQRGRAEAAKRAAENGDLESFPLLERKQTADGTELTYPC